VIKKLSPKNVNDVYYFVLKTNDKFFDFYITINKERVFLNNINTIRRLLKNQKIYALYDGEIKGLLLIFIEKGFRRYLRILTNDRNVTWALCRFFSWNFFDETYAKLKVGNPILRSLQKIGFIEKGNRGKEILLYRPRQPKHFFKGDSENDPQ